MPAANTFLSHTYLEIKCCGLESWSLSKSPNPTSISMVIKTGECKALSKKTKTLLVRRIHWRVLEVIKYISFNKENYEQYLSRNYGQSNISELGHAGKLVGHSPTIRKSQVQLGQAKEDETVSRTPPWPLHPLLSHVLALNSLSDFFQQ